MQIIFCLVLTFKHIANKLFPNFKNIVHIKKDIFFDFLMLVHVKLHNYNQDNNKENTKIPPLFLFSSTVCLLAFVQLAHDTNDVFCKLFVALLVHQACAENNKDEL